MSSLTYPRRVGKTGRPLGILDVLAKILDTAAAGLRAWAASHRARQTRREANSDAAAVRRLADEYRSVAPGFASDLYAAADQHELRSAR
ncbi:hypothetical protein ABXN37_15170 [Piscinibacter sakaiensis]|uniref:hypothetical protein n=1 Tax=Piscinibacter sakaiensis TaxID=1547922 RepID=UPI00372B37F5